MAQSFVVCPDCSTEFELANPMAQPSAACPNCQREFLMGAVFDGIVVETGPIGKSKSPAPPSVEHLLPPRFLVADPDFVEHRSQKGSGQFVLLPDGKGGIRSVDENIIRIEHRGQTVELVALPIAEKRKRQRLINFIFIVIGIVFLVIFFALI